MDFKIPKEFGFQLNSGVTKHLMMQTALSNLRINRTINILSWQSEKLEITKCDIKLKVEIVHSFSTKNNHTRVRFKNWSWQIGTSNLAIQYAEKPII